MVIGEFGKLQREWAFKKGLLAMDEEGCDCHCLGKLWEVGMGYGILNCEKGLPQYNAIAHYA